MRVFNLLFYKRKRFARFATATSSADTVHIVVVGFGNIVVDHVGHIGDI